jgi:hypothetical protein
MSGLSVRRAGPGDVERLAEDKITGNAGSLQAQ